MLVPFRLRLEWHLAKALHASLERRFIATLKRSWALGHVQHLQTGVGRYSQGDPSCDLSCEREVV